MGYVNPLIRLKLKHMLGEQPVAHYYGDIVRRVFLIAAATMFVTIPFVKMYVYMPIYATLLAVIALVLASGMTSPRKKVMSFVDLIISIGGVLLFGYQAVVFVSAAPAYFFLLNLALGLLFLSSLYFASKTVRGMVAL